MKGIFIFDSNNFAILHKVDAELRQLLAEKQREVMQADDHQSPSSSSESSMFQHSDDLPQTSSQFHECQASFESPINGAQTDTTAAADELDSNVITHIFLPLVVVHRVLKLSQEQSCFRISGSSIRFSFREFGPSELLIMILSGQHFSADLQPAHDLQAIETFCHFALGNLGDACTPHKIRAQFSLIEQLINGYFDAQPPSNAMKPVEFQRNQKLLHSSLTGQFVDCSSIIDYSSAPLYNRLLELLVFELKPFIDVELSILVERRRMVAINSRAAAPAAKIAKPQLNAAFLNTALLWAADSGEAEVGNFVKHILAFAPIGETKQANGHPIGLEGEREMVAVDIYAFQMQPELTLICVIPVLNLSAVSQLQQVRLGLAFNEVALETDGESEKGGTNRMVDKFYGANWDFSEQPNIMRMAAYIYLPTVFRHATKRIVENKQTLLLKASIANLKGNVANLFCTLEELLDEPKSGAFQNLAKDWLAVDSVMSQHPPERRSSIIARRPSIKPQAKANGSLPSGSAVVVESSFATTAALASELSPEQSARKFEDDLRRHLNRFAQNLSAFAVSFVQKSQLLSVQYRLRVLRRHWPRILQSRHIAALTDGRLLVQNRSLRPSARALSESERSALFESSAVFAYAFVNLQRRISCCCYASSLAGSDLEMAKQLLCQAVRFASSSGSMSAAVTDLHLFTAIIASTTAYRNSIAFSKETASSRHGTRRKSSIETLAPLPKAAGGKKTNWFRLPGLSSCAPCQGNVSDQFSNLAESILVVVVCESALPHNVAVSEACKIALRLQRQIEQQQVSFVS